MAKLIAWLINNKDWLFSGIGLVVITAVFNCVKKRIKSKKEEELVDKDWEEVTKSIEIKANIMIIGPVGVGKSTLINALFDIEDVVARVGRPVRTEIKPFTKGKLTIYDSAGIEINTEFREAYANKSVNFISDKMRLGVEEQIHLILYCVQPPRLQDAEMKYLEKISKCFNDMKFNIPILIVNTRPYSISDEDTDNYKSYIHEQFTSFFPNNNDNGLHEVQAFTYSSRGSKQEAFGLDELLKAITDALPEAQKVATIRYARMSVDIKCEEAKKLANKYIAAASSIAIGATTLGIDDSIALLALELAMCAHIGSLFNFELNVNKVKAVVMASLSTTLVSSVAKTAGRWVIRICSGGTSMIIEGAARTGIAATAVAGLSTFFIELMRSYAAGELDDEAVTQKLIEKLKKKK